MSKNLAASWCSLQSVQDNSLTPNHWQWVSNTDSLTKRLRSMFGEQINFHLQKAQLDKVYPEERAMLGLSGEASQWVREIEWRAQSDLLVAARVVIPTGSTNPLMCKLYGIGGSSIGDTLFQRGGFEREQMLFAKIFPGHPYFNMANIEQRLRAPFLWARSSIFVAHQDRLLVSEVFLPEFFKSVGDHDL